MKRLMLISASALFSACLSQISVGPSNLCNKDADCVPSTCCHPTQCSSVGSAPQCENVACTLECRVGALDCGGSCRCIQNKCVAETSQQLSKELCEGEGGSWQRRYSGEFCNFPAADAGNPCTSREQCEGECVAEGINATSGNCSKFKTVFGCVTLLNKGQALGVCID